MAGRGKEMNIMTIDPGKIKTGIFIKTDSYTKSFLINNTKCKNDYEIFKNLYYEIQEIIYEHNIEIIFIEDYAFAYKKSRSVTSLGEIKGMIKSSIYTIDNRVGVNKPKIYYLPIQLWKSYINKEVRALKKKNKRYRETINKLYNKNFKSTDECDAYLMMVAIHLILKGVIKTKACQDIYNFIKGEENVYSNKDD